MMLKWLLRFALLPTLASAAEPPTFAFPAGARGEPAALDAAMPGLARELLAVYTDPDRSVQLGNTFRLQLVAGRHSEALATIRELRTLSVLGGAPQVRAAQGQYEVFARAMLIDARQPGDFPDAFRVAFRDTFATLDDRSSALLLRAFGSDSSERSRQRQALAAAIAAQDGRTRIAQTEALALLRAWLVDRVYERFAQLAPALVIEQDARRYLIERDVQVAMPDGAIVCALIVRPRRARGALTALLNFTIYADPGTLLNEARRSASHGYAGVGGMTRGKGCSPGPAVPYETDGRDAAALIDWIAAQPWSDGRVGTFGGSYEGFTQWAAAKHRPKALKAMMPSVTGAPGIDVPTEGGIGFAFQYYWPFYVTNNKTVDNQPYEDNARWDRMFRTWYQQGRAWRDLGLIDGAPNPIWQRWLDHPDYDAYWQSMVPVGDEFDAIDIPILTTTGYFDGAQIGALHYVREHHRHRPDAQHYLLVGPYNHVTGQRGTVAWGDLLRGYRIDPVAAIDIGELRYQWFDFALRGGPKPALLRDRINYQVMGANRWKHAPSLAAMSERRLRLHLGAPGDDGNHRLTEDPGGAGAVALQTLDLRDRSDVDEVVPEIGIVDRRLDARNSLVFVSDSLRDVGEFSGLFSGRLVVTSNKRDFDLHIGLFELSAQGEYFELSRFQSRASYLLDRGTRHLLVPGEKHAFDFSAGRMSSRRFAAGSRIVAVLSTLRQPSMQINYGSGKAVSDETIADAGEPLQLHWHGDSYLEFPVTR
jgi:putative CocE/NonD family hydrolase